MKWIQVILSLVFSFQALGAGRTSDEMVLIPEGEFLMGSKAGGYDEAPERRVRVSAFLIDRYEVCNSEYAAYLRESQGYLEQEGVWFRYSVEGCLDLVEYLERRYGGPYRSVKELELTRMDERRWLAALSALSEKSGRTVHDIASVFVRDLRSDEHLAVLMDTESLFPVRGVTWRDARGFARYFGKRLPTEAEWERAARGDEALLYPWGNDWNGMVISVPVEVTDERLGENEIGVVGMSGNVWEWVEDWYGENYYERGECIDPKGPEGLADGALPFATSPDALLRSGDQGRESDTRKVIRGGGFGGTEQQAKFNYRCSRRMWCNPNYWHADIGFRCVKDL